ncbi:hypothetical protein HPB50_026675 [Hyalomma asiaticum]|uniref:Uncharacterized protein n=1 Tax=Hyalomma asiaticum TaxID=266040 RepID=A0ACB7TS17_HYAAI|nr:hypothetical protein HPB50_026675 [Hyalomma asiaticum]
MNNDESGQFSLGSDHNRVKLTFCKSSWWMNPKDHRSPAKRHLPQTAYEAIAEKFTHNFRPTDPQNYDEFVRELKHIMKQQEIPVNSRGGNKRKGWWDKEVQDALVTW